MHLAMQASALPAARFPRVIGVGDARLDLLRVLRVKPLHVSDAVLYGRPSADDAEAARVAASRGSGVGAHEVVQLLSAGEAWLQWFVREEVDVLGLHIGLVASLDGVYHRTESLPEVRLYLLGAPQVLLLFSADYLGGSVNGW